MSIYVRVYICFRWALRLAASGSAMIIKRARINMRQIQSALCVSVKVFAGSAHFLSHIMRGLISTVVLVVVVAVHIYIFHSNMHI